MFSNKTTSNSSIHIINLQTKVWIKRLWRRHILPLHNSCCLPWWGHVLWGKYTPPTSHSPVQFRGKEICETSNTSRFANLRSSLKTNPQSRTYVVGGPPGFEFEVPLQSGSQVFLKVLRQGCHTVKLLIVHQCMHWLQILSEQRNK